MIEGLPAGPPVERPAGVPIAAYGPRCVPDCVCLGGHTTAPHHLSGPPPPATAMLEIGAMVAAPIVNAATASAIASDVFMVWSPFKFLLKTILRLRERDSSSSLKMALWRLPQIAKFLPGLAS